MDAGRKRVFITGATGYLGSRLAPHLIERGHFVRALVRESSRAKLPSAFAISAPNPQCDVAIGDVLKKETSVEAARGFDTFVQLIGVAHPAPVMKEYIAVRMEGERLVRESGMAVTILRPWYVLGPGHRWAYAIAPIYWLAERVPAWREGARRLGLVTVRQMVAALALAAELDSPKGVAIWEVPKIRDAEI